MRLRYAFHLLDVEYSASLLNASLTLVIAFAPLIRYESGTKAPLCCIPDPPYTFRDSRWAYKAPTSSFGLQSRHLAHTCMCGTIWSIEPDQVHSWVLAIVSSFFWHQEWGQENPRCSQAARFQSHAVGLKWTNLLEIQWMIPCKASLVGFVQSPCTP